MQGEQTLIYSMSIGLDIVQQPLFIDTPKLHFSYISSLRLFIKQIWWIAKLSFFSLKFYSFVWAEKQILPSFKVQRNIEGSSNGNTTAKNFHN